MTTLGQHEGYGLVAETLARVEQHYRRVRVWSGLAGWLAVTIGTLLVITLIAGLLRLGSHPSGAEVFARRVLMAILLLVPIAAAGWLIVRPILQRRTAEQVARAVEERIGNLNNGLINTIQLARDPQAGPPSLVARAIAEASRNAQLVSPDQAVDLRGLKRWSILAGGLLLATMLYVVLGPNSFYSGLRSVLQPSRFIARAGRVRIVKVHPGDTQILADKPLSIIVEVENPQNEPLDARLFIITPKGTTLAKKMVPFGGRRQKYKHNLPPVAESFRYRIEVDTSQTPIYAVKVIDRVRVESLGLYYRYPAYTGAANKQSDDPNIEAPLGTRIDLTLRLDTPVGTARLETASGLRVELKDAGLGQAFSAQLEITRDDQYAIVLLDRSGQEFFRLPDPAKDVGKAQEVSANGRSGKGEQGYWPIRVVPDLPPKVSVVRPGRDVTASPGDKVELTVKATDDYRVKHVAVFVKKGKGAEGEFKKLAEASKFADRKEAVLECAIDVDKQAYKEGDVITYYASATDNRHLPGIGEEQTTPSDMGQAVLFQILVQDSQRIEKDRLARLEQLRERLKAILAAQVKVKGETVQAKHVPQAAPRAASSEKIHIGQGAIQRELTKLGETFPFDSETEELKHTILVLAHNEVATATAAAAMLKQLADAGKYAQAADDLIVLQQQIIGALQTLIGLIPDLMDKKVEGELGHPGGDIPPDVLAKLQDLRDQLEKFMEQQRKVIEASKYLAKRPVDSWTEEDRKQLEELAALEDQWEKFMAEQVTDFSKLAEQDFSDSQLLQELVEVRDDLKMAKDALSKKATEIAVPVEESGLELAEALETHLEKWLSDEPDRQAWKMEEPLGDQTDVPMAELPKELEDLIGELMEDEEDLFEEMDDVTSKWTDSLDKGAGWDALDGPISNMSAQGVTGNHLPNTSEISGRSGQGRSGKSVGEMVEESAQDLGGRRTPTRLSHDPFQKGEINDMSKEDGMGGATGGGKLSGAGGEGLEGPIAPELQREMGRLSQKQAALRNQAEKINLALEVKNYKNFKLLDSIRMMRRVEDDLSNYRYQNAFRRKNVILEGLQTSRVLLGGQIAVQQDATPGLPREVRDDIADAMQGEMPKGYKDLLKKYYENLSAAGAMK
ncbi:MAG: hypothetical protein JXQ73_30150 [Phycisphaerae bacterium]|nr:hypothetical protein [Phycisphaerae bacterium]